MSNHFTVYTAAGIMTALATFAGFMGHIEPLALYQVIGSIVGTAALSSFLGSFK